MDYLATDRPALYAQATARLAVYAAEWVDGDAGVRSARDLALDLWLATRELHQVENPNVATQAERRAALLIGYVVERHGLGALPLPVSALPTVGISTGGGPVSWSQIIGIPGNLVYGPLTPGSITGFTVAVQALIDASPGGASAHVELTGVDVVVKPGEVSPTGQKHLSAQVATDLLALLYPYVPPTVSLSLSPSGLQELGTTVAVVTLDGGFVVNSDAAPTVGLYKQDGVTFLTQVSGIGDATTRTNVAATSVFVFQAVFPTSGTKTVSVTYPFVAPTFYGATATTAPSEATVEAGTKQLWERAARSLVIACAGTHPFFAEPQSNGIRTQFMDGFGNDITSDLVRVSVTYTLADGVTTAPYYRYVHANPQTDAGFILLPK